MASMSKSLARNNKSPEGMFGSAALEKDCAGSPFNKAKFGFSVPMCSWPVKLSKPVLNSKRKENNVRKLLLVCAIGVAGIVGASAFSTSAEARVFCYNRITGQFLNWGHCKPRAGVCNYYGPGGYCRPVRYRIVAY
jgi:hypothetical protein